MTALKWKRDRPGRQVTTLGWFAVELEDRAPTNGPLSWAAILFNPVGGSGEPEVTLGVFSTMREAKACCQARAEWLGDLVAEPNVSDGTEGVLGPPDQPPPPVYTGDQPWSIQTESGLFVDGIGPYDMRPPPDTPANEQGNTTQAGMTTHAETPLVPLAELFPDLFRSNINSVLRDNFGCPTCGARRGKPCRTKSGRVARQPHSKRLAKIPTPSDAELREVFAFTVTRPCPNCGDAEIARYIELHRNKYFPSHRHHFYCANCDHTLGYWDKASRGPLPRDAGWTH